MNSFERTAVPSPRFTQMAISAVQLPDVTQRDSSHTVHVIHLFDGYDLGLRGSRANVGLLTTVLSREFPRGKVEAEP